MSTPDGAEALFGSSAADSWHSDRLPRSVLTNA
jgi:hypothetical protein